MPLQPTGTRVPVGRVRPGTLAPAAERRSLGAGECLLCQRSTVRYGSTTAPTFIPNADVRRNVCLPQTHQSQIGQEQPYSEVTDSGRSHRRFRATPPQL
jgi:hypothetical protein